MKRIRYWIIASDGINGYPLATEAKFPVDPNDIQWIMDNTEWLDETMELEFYEVDANRVTL